MSLLSTQISMAAYLYDNVANNANGGIGSEGYETISFLNDSSMKDSDKLVRLLETMKAKVTTMNKVNKTKFIYKLDRIMTEYNYYPAKNGKRAMYNIKDNRGGINAGIDIEIYSLIEHLALKAIKHDNSEFDKFESELKSLVEKINFDEYNIKLSDSNGVGRSYNLIKHEVNEYYKRFDYHDKPDTGDEVITQKNQKKNESLKGFELEGCFSDDDDFQKCMKELRNTPFMGGTLYDERNLLMPTNDSSLNDDYFPCEFGLPPMSNGFAEQFFEVLMPILSKGGFERDSDEYFAGMHCHIDARLFNQKSLKKLIDLIYDMPESQKLELYQRRGNSYCSGRKENCYRTELAYKGFKKEEDKDLFVRENIIKYSGERYGLVNLQHLHFLEDERDQTNYDLMTGTIELRGANGACSPLDLIKEYDKIIAEALKDGK